MVRISGNQTAEHLVVYKVTSSLFSQLPLSHSDTVLPVQMPVCIPSPAAVFRKTKFFCVLSVVFNLETYDGSKEAY
ncbi:hypothetical protein E2C01_068714 [Portunus trituberculatus]|uniref:Uncharacterized protein n=1 Tax=Portunus trituberculatus TaxID=210409 RepID=A0A5B7HXA1_PORTR|nr:hypothetical protein [Portunus trituberculatus]